MGSQFDRLWRAAQQRVWTQRPMESDIQPLAPALNPSDSVEGVWRIVWSSTKSGALVVSSRALLIGDGRLSPQFKSVYDSAPAAFRSGPRALVIPRGRITKVVLNPDRIVVHTDVGRVVLPSAEGSSRYPKMEQALLALSRLDALTAFSAGEKSLASLPVAGVPGRETTTQSYPRYPGLWSGRDRIDGEIKIRRRASVAPTSGVAGWVASAGRAWRRLSRWVQWVVALAIFFGLQTVAAPAGVVFGVLMVLFLGATDLAAAEKRGPRAGSPEALLAISSSIEGRVAGAACRAWSETLSEPSWSSPVLAGTRATFDGDHEVDTIIDLALRIHAARDELGERPTGPAADLWRQQMNALDQAALRLGERADALIRHRDQAADLSTELAQLDELERLERSALVIDDLTIATSAASPGDGGSSVSDQITAAREAVGELIELMTRTRAPLAESTGPVVP